MGAFMGLILTIIAECLLQLCIYLFIYLSHSLLTSVILYLYTVLCLGLGPAQAIGRQSEARAV